MPVSAMLDPPFFYPRPAPSAEFLVEEKDYDITRYGGVVHLTVWGGWSRRVESDFARHAVNTLTVRGDAEQFDPNLGFLSGVSVRDLRLVLYGRFDLSSVTGMDSLISLRVVSGGTLTVARPLGRANVVELRAPCSVAGPFIQPALNVLEITDVGRNGLDLTAATRLRDLSVSRIHPGAEIAVVAKSGVRSLQLVDTRVVPEALHSIFHQVHYFSIAGRVSVDWNDFADASRVRAVLLIEIPASANLDGLFKIPSLQCIDMFPPLLGTKSGRAIADFNARRCGVASLTPVMDALAANARAHT